MEAGKPPACESAAIAQPAPPGENPRVPNLPPDQRPREAGDAIAPGSVAVHPFRFTGTVAEYFRIWIVNLFLSAVSLGVYSAWAKVRRTRYFYANTWVDGANFDYHAEPLAILKGRAIAVCGFLAFTLVSWGHPRAGAAIGLAFVPALAWLVLRTLQFKAFNSSYRNVRFRFRGSYLDALRVVGPLGLSPLLVLVLPAPDWWAIREGGSGLPAALLQGLASLLVLPYVVGALTRFQVNNTSLGSAPFAREVRGRAYFGAFYAAFAIAIAMGIIAAMFFAMFGAVVVAIGPAVAQLAIPFIQVMAMAVALGFARARIANMLLNATTLGGGVRFTSGIDPVKLAGMYAVNVAAIGATFGLAVPWAVIRTARYRASCLRIEAAGELEALAVGDGGAAPGAAGEQIADFLHLDFSL